MNCDLDELEKNLFKCQAEFDLGISLFLKTLQIYNDRLEKIEKCIDHLRNLMLN